jgi:hypothetical protein
MYHDPNDGQGKAASQRHASVDFPQRSAREKGPNRPKQQIVYFCFV